MLILVQGQYLLLLVFSNIVDPKHLHWILLDGKGGGREGGINGRSKGGREGGINGRSKGGRLGIVVRSDGERYGVKKGGDRERWSPMSGTAMSINV